MRIFEDALTEPLFDDTAPSHAPVQAQPPSRELVRLGEKLPRGIYLGTSSWNFPGWRGIVWAPMSGTKTLARDGLSAYSRYPIFKTTGIDRAYYRPLTAAQYRAFADQVPENFRFLVKAPQQVTDYALRDERGRAIGRNPDYLNLQLLQEQFVWPAVEGLGKKIGALVLELSPIPREDISDINKKHAQIDRLGAFAHALPTEALEGKRLLFAVEMRTQSLLTRRYVKAIRDSAVRPVVSLHPSMPSIMRQTEMVHYLDAPDVDGGPWKLRGDIVIRWSLAANGTYQSLRRQWHPFNVLQEPDLVTREGIVWLLSLAAKSGVKAYAVANNKAEGCAPLTMRAIAESLTGFRVDSGGKEQL